MIKYFIVFCLLSLTYNLLKTSIMFSNCFDGGMNELLVTKVRILGIPFTIFTSSIITTSILILLLGMKLFLSWQAQPFTFDGIGYEKIVKDVKIILITGILLMILSLFHNFSEIQLFGKQLFLLKNKSKILLSENKEMNWQYEIRVIWIFTAVISCILFSIRLYNKLKVHLYPSILVGVILFLCLSFPYHEQIYQSLKCIIQR